MKTTIMMTLLTTMTFAAWGKTVVEKESLNEVEQYKLDKPVKEKAASRAFAGSKAKKEKSVLAEDKDSLPTLEDSELRYWKYSEEPLDADHSKD